MTKEQRRKRTKIGIGIIGSVFVMLVFYLVKIQIIDGAEYKAASANLAVTQRTMKASRGEILDASGNPLVTNRQGYCIVFKYADFPSYKDQEARNKVICELIKLFEENLKPLLMAAPLKGKVVMGFDPGIRTGCKIAVVDETGKVLDKTVVYATRDNDKDKEKSRVVLKELINKYIGNLEMIIRK